MIFLKSGLKVILSKKVKKNLNEWKLFSRPDLNDYIDENKSS